MSSLSLHGLIKSGEPTQYGNSITHEEYIKIESIFGLDGLASDTRPSALIPFSHVVCECKTSTSLTSKSSHTTKDMEIQMTFNE